jgi:hypothetical protein
MEAGELDEEVFLIFYEAFACFSFGRWTTLS